jgi:hypothetical protein
VPISGVVTVGVFGDFTEDFIVTCGAYSNSADIAVVINIGLIGDNGDEWRKKTFNPINSPVLNIVKLTPILVKPLQPRNTLRLRTLLRLITLASY